MGLGDFEVVLSGLGDFEQVLGGLGRGTVRSNK